jgi:hypothetical protein
MPEHTHISSYPPYMEAVSSIRNARTRHAVVTKVAHSIATTCKYQKAASQRYDYETECEKVALLTQLQQIVSWRHDH